MEGLQANTFIFVMIVPDEGLRPTVDAFQRDSLLSWHMHLSERLVVAVFCLPSAPDSEQSKV